MPTAEREELAHHVILPSRDKAFAFGAKRRPPWPGWTAELTGRRPVAGQRSTAHSQVLQDRYRRLSLVAVPPGEGQLTEQTAGVQPWLRTRVLDDFVLVQLCAAFGGGIGGSEGGDEK